MEIEGGLVVTQKNEFQSYFNRGIIISTISILLLLYLTIEHFSHNHHALCDLSETFSCSALKNSEYSKLFGVPVACFGVVYYFVVFYSLYKGKTLNHDSPQCFYYISFVYYFLMGGVGYLLYLIMAEIRLATICPVCTFLHLLHVYFLYCTWLMQGKRRRKFQGVIDVVIEFKITFLLFLIVSSGLIIQSAMKGSEGSGSEERGRGSEKLAECVTSAGWKMVGSSDCNVCQYQKSLFSEGGFNKIEFLDCKVDQSYCDIHSITSYPTWLLFLPSTDNTNDLKVISRWEGVASLPTLLLLSSCPSSLLSS